MELSEISSDDKIILQSNKLTSGRYDYTACQLDILYLLMALLTEQDPPDKVYELSVKDIELITGRQWQYQQIRESIETMMSRTIELYNDSKGWKLIAAFQSAEYVTQGGTLRLVLSKDMRPLLFDLKNNFTKMQLTALLTCSSKYAKRLYALACQWRSVGIIRIPIDELKEKLSLKDPKGKIPEQFERINDFKKYVLDIAKAQINTNTDIEFDYELLKKSRAYTHIKVFIGMRKLKELQLQIDFNKPLDQQKELAEIMAYGISESAAEKIVPQINKFREIVDQVKKDVSKNKTIIKDTPAYIMGVLKKRGVI